MRRLFFKLFFSFWVALVFFSAAVILAAAVYLDQTRARHDSATPFERGERHLAEAQAASDARGLEGLRAWAKRADAEELVPVLVLDAQGNDLLNREVSPRALAHLARRLHVQQTFGVARRPPIHVEGGGEYWLVPDFQGATLGRLISRPRVLAVPLILATLVGGLVCLVLARHLASPIERLRRAAAAYASGDFRQRVGPTLGRRRDEIADLAKALDDMAERVGMLIRSQQTLLRDVSHELRSPLARVQAAVGLARQRAAGSATVELERIERETERLNELIGEILTFSRLDSGVRETRVEPFGLDQLVSDVVADATIEAQAKDCTVRHSVPPEAPCTGDPALLHSAVENVLRNAIRHAPAGSEVTVDLTMEPGAGKSYLIRVGDRGPGVAEDMLERIFEPFVRADDSRHAQAGGGIGLGLAIARRAVQAHGGEIRAANRSEGGLLVTIRLPKTG